MAFINPDDHGGSGAQLTPDSIQNHTTTAQNIVISPAGLTEVPLPGGGFVTNAVMTQEGSDLILESPDGITLVIEGYFSGEAPPNLISDGKVLTPALVKSFIQASTDYAEDKVAMNDATPVGQVHEVSGHATVTHPDGTSQTIVKGTPIYEGDVVETDAKGAVNIQFVDESSFAVSNNAKMAIDEFVYDSSTHGGENNFSMLRGLFVYTSGLVGREDPDDVKIQTPVGSIGIRGTIITGSLPGEGSSEPAKISVVEGAIVIEGTNGNSMTLSQQFETVQIDTNGMQNVGIMPQTEMAQTFNVLRTVAPTFFSAMEEAQQEQKPAQDALPADAPVPSDVQDAAPQTDAQPQPSEETTPQTPTPAPDVIHLNLLPGVLDQGLDKQLTQTTLSTDTSSRTASTVIVSQPVFSPMSSAQTSAPAIAQLSAANADTTATTPNTNTTTPAGTVPGTVNVAPVAPVTNYQALEQAGHNAGTHSFDVGHFFFDANGDPLTYSVAVLSDTFGVINSVTVEPSGMLVFTVNGTVPAAASPVSFVVTASDGSLTSNQMMVSLNVYQTTSSLDATNDVETVTTANTILATNGGEDDVSITANNNIVFGGDGTDTLTISGGNGNKIFGEDGDDTLTIVGGTGNLASGGNGNDLITITGTTGSTYQIFGGTGNDIINIGNADALNALTLGTSVIDGGTGFDTLTIGMSAGNVNLQSIPATALIGIEKIRLMATGPTTISLDLDDLFANSGHSLYIDVAANHSVNITNTTNLAGLTATGNTVTDPAGESYREYSNGNMTLYLSSDATLANVSGAGITV